MDTLFLRITLLMLTNHPYVVFLQNETNETNERSQSLMFIFPDNYSAYQPPQEIDGSLVKLRAYVVPVIVDNVIGESMDFEINFYLMIQWNDTRLTSIDKDTLIDEEEFAKKLWMPEIQFRNCRDCTRHSFQKSDMLLSYEKQQFTWYARKTMKFICELKFQKYPMDTQVCAIQIESYPGALDLHRHSKLPAEIMTVEDIKPPQFIIIDSRPVGKCNSFIIISKFQCVEYRLTFQRQITYHMTFTYLPSVMIVMVSWISFWLNVEMVSPRAALGLTPLLALVTQFAGTQESLPPVAYMKAMDLWMFICIFLVFASLAEFALASHIHRRNLSKSKIQVVNTSADPNVPNEESQKKVTSSSTRWKSTSKIDTISRYLFPISFLIFNICYWPFYLN